MKIMKEILAVVFWLLIVGLILLILVFGLIVRLSQGLRPGLIAEDPTESQ